MGGALIRRWTSLGARLAQQPDDLLGRRPAHDRVVDDDQPLVRGRPRASGLSLTLTPRWRIAWDWAG